MNYIDVAKEVFDIEISELSKLRNRIDTNFEDVVNCILNGKGRLIITGIGKSGIIGKKIAASLASTGTNTLFMHAAEALHGDLGMVNKNDIVLAISNSGSSQEVLDLLPSLNKIGCTLISMTGNPNSVLALHSKFSLDIAIESEACPLGLAPTSSTTATLLMGDALTVSLIKARDFKPENFAVYHPGGALGRRLLTKVSDIMSKEVPQVSTNTHLKDIIYEISSKRVGMTTVIDETKTVVGIITDGDIRRNIFDKHENLDQVTASQIMTKSFKSISALEKANIAWEIMNTNNISLLPVVNELNSIIGIISMHDVFEFQNQGE